MTILLHFLRRRNAIFKPQRATVFTYFELKLQNFIIFAQIKLTRMTYNNHNATLGTTDLSFANVNFTPPVY